MKQMWPFGHVGDLLLHDSGPQRAAASAGAAHRKALTQHMPLPCGRSESTQAMHAWMATEPGEIIKQPTCK